MAKLIITRSNEWINRARGIRIYINGNKIGKIANGETKDIELPNGNYLLKAKIDWCGSKDYIFDIGENETKNVMLSSFGFSWNFFPISAVVIALNTILFFLLKIEYLTWFAIPFLAILFYYFSIGRNNYLVLKDTENFS